MDSDKALTTAMERIHKELLNLQHQESDIKKADQSAQDNWKGQKKGLEKALQIVAAVRNEEGK